MSNAFTHRVVTGASDPRNFRPQRKWLTVSILLGAGSLTAMSGTAITPSLPGIASEFAQTPNAEFLAKLALTLPALFIALTATFIGVLVDRVGTRAVLIASALLFAIAGGSGILAPNLVFLLTGRAVLGIAIAGLTTATLALVGALFHDRQRHAIVGYLGTAMSFGGMVFLVLGGALAQFDWRWPFATYLVSLALVPMMLLGLPRTDAAQPNETARPDGARPLRWQKIAAIYSIAMLGMMVFYVVPVQLPFYLAARGTHNPALAGYALATCTCTSALVSFSYRHVRRVISATGAIALTFLFIGAGQALTTAGGYSLVLMGMAVAGLGAGLLLPTANALVLATAPARWRGRAAGGLATCLFVGQFLAPFAVTFVAGSSPSDIFESAAITSSAIGMVIGLFSCLRAVRVPRPGILDTVTRQRNERDRG